MYIRAKKRKGEAEKGAGGKKKKSEETPEEKALRVIHCVPIYCFIVRNPSF